MPINYRYGNGFEITKEDLETRAIEENMTTSDYISNYGLEEFDNGGDLSMGTGILNSMKNLSGEVEKIAIDFKLFMSELAVKDLMGESAASFFLGGDADRGFIDPENGQIVKFNEEAWRSKGYGAEENERYYELEQLRKKDPKFAEDQNQVLSNVQVVDTKTGRDMGDIYTEQYQKAYDKSLSIPENALQITDEGITGFTDALKKGEIDDMLVLSFDFIKQTALHAAAAFATRGVSMAATMGGMSYVSYNSEKAKFLYGDDPNAFSKLMENKEDEMAIPAALGAIGFALERIGYRGMAAQLAKKSFTGKGAASLLLAGGTEGFTEWGQGLTEKLNQNLGTQMGVEKAVAGVADYMFTEESMDNFFAGLIGGTGMTGGGKIIQGALRSGQNSNQFIHEKWTTIAALVEQQALSGSTKEFDKIQNLIQIQETELKDYLESNKKLSTYLNDNQITDLTSLVNSRRDTSKKVTDLRKAFKKGIINRTQYNIESAELLLELKSIDSKVETIKIDATMKLLKADIDSGKEFVGDIKGMEMETYDTQEEFDWALEMAYEQAGIEMPDFRGIDINGLKLGNKILVNMQVAAKQNAIATSTHEVLHGIVKSSVQESNGSGLLSAKGQKRIEMFVNQLSSSERAAIEDLLKKGGYKFNKDGTEKEFKEYGEEYLNMYAQLSKEGKFTKNSIIKAGSWFVDLWKSESDFKQIGWESGEQIRNFLDAYVEDTKTGNYREKFKQLARLGVAMPEFDGGPGLQLSAEKVTEVKNKVDAIGKEKNYDPGNDDDQNRRVISELPNMVKVQVDNYFNSRKSLQADKSVRAEVAADVLFRLINPTKKGRSDVTGFIPGINNSLYGYLNGRIKYRMLDTFKNNPTIVPDFSNVDFDEATKYLTDTPVAPKTISKKNNDLNKISKRILKSLADLDVESSPFIKAFTKQRLQKIIQSNPVDINTEIQNVLIPDVVDAMLKEVGTINTVKGKTNIPDTYLAYLADSYEQTIKSMEILKIRTNYKTLFKKVKKGVADYKTKKSDKPTIKKDSNYVKDIYKNITTKAEFTKYHIEGLKTTLMAKQRKLITMRAEAEIAQAADNYINNNSTNETEVFNSGLRLFVDSMTVDKQALEDKSFDSVQFSKTKIQDAFYLRDAVLAGESVFDNNGNLLPPYNGISKNKKDLKLVGDFIYENMHLLTYDNDMAFIQKTYDKLELAGDRGTAYETNLINTLIAAEKAFGKSVIDVVLRKPTEKGGKPDLIVRVHGVDLNIEAKMSNAQYSSVTVAIENAKMVIKKKYTFNPLIQKLIDRIQPGIKASKEAIKKQFKEDWVDVSVLKTEHYNYLKNTPVTIDGVKYKSYINAMSATSAFPLEGVSEIYNNKKPYPVHLIQLMGRGLFHMGPNIFGLDIPRLKGDASITLRISSNTKYRVVNEQDVANGSVESIYTDGTNSKLKGQKKTKRTIATGMRGLSFRAIPTISADQMKTNKLTSDHSVGNLAGIQSFVKDQKTKFGLESMAKASKVKTISNAIQFSRSSFDKFQAQKQKGKQFVESILKKPKGITVLDFDDTLATTKSMIKYTKPDGTKGKLNAEQYASTYEDLLGKGYAFDFSEFSQVVKGKTAPLFQKALKLARKFGTKDMYVLTARPADSAVAIQVFLKENGLEIPLENITGLANSTSESKALWMAGKVSEGYNDFYFADDALQNVQAVKNMLDQFDVKSKVQQAKVSFSKQLSPKFNEILQRATGINSKKVFSKIKGEKRGKDKGKFRPFVPPGAEDFIGLLYNFMGTGKKGNADRDFFQKSLINPYNEAYRMLENARMSINNNYSELRKKLPEVTKTLGKKSKVKDFSNGDAIRVYLWDKAGHEIPGLSESDRLALVDLVVSNPDMSLFAELLNNIPNTKDGYTTPKENWGNENIAADLYNVAQNVNRAKYLEPWVENKNEMFTEANMNKIEAAYGKNFREALEDMLYRMEYGKSRPKGLNRQTNSFLNWINNSVGAIMFINGRSAVLQTMSMVNFLNFADNNVFMAAKAFANFPQYIKDFTTIFNSDYLKSRRTGLKQDINAAEMAESVKNSDNKFTAMVAWILEKGFLPTKIMDSFAIAAGGATFLRNRIDKLVKEGMNLKDAEKKAFDDMVQVAEPLQQSSRPDFVSQQQASILGHLVLAFQNVTMQYTRIQKKAALDIIKSRTTPPNTNLTQSNISNASRILYYGIVQNAIFYGLQSAMFALGFGDEEEEAQQELFDKKSERMANGMLDSALRGTGIYGAFLSAAKNYTIELVKEQEKGYSQTEANPLVQLLNVSPPVGSKARKLVSFQRSLRYNEAAIKDMSLTDINNPIWEATSLIIEGTTNLPTNRTYNKTQNTREVMDERNNNMQRIFLFLGWDRYGLSVENEEQKAAKDLAKKKEKDRKKAEKKQKNRKF